MTFEEKLRAINEELKWLSKTCIDDDSIECAQAAIAAQLAILHCIDVLHQHGLNEFDWKQQPVEGRTT